MPAVVLRKSSSTSARGARAHDESGQKNRHHQVIEVAEKQSDKSVPLEALKELVLRETYIGTCVRMGGSGKQYGRALLWVVVVPHLARPRPTILWVEGE